MLDFPRNLNHLVVIILAGIGIVVCRPKHKWKSEVLHTTAKSTMHDMKKTSDDVQRKFKERWKRLKNIFRSQTLDMIRNLFIGECFNTLLGV